MKTVEILHRSGKSNANADALSRCHQAAAPQEGIAQGKVQVAQVCATDLWSVLSAPQCQVLETDSFAQEQRKDPNLNVLAVFLETGKCPQEEDQARKMALQSPLFVLLDAILYFMDPKQDQRK